MNQAVHDAQPIFLALKSLSHSFQIIWKGLQMQSELPFYESPEQALEACVQALGGAKTVGPMLWPEKTIDNARTYLLACMNADRAEKLNYSQLIFIFRAAKLAGFHAGYQWFSAQIEYDVRPITKAEEVDRLTSVIEQSSKALTSAIAALERVQQGQSLRVAK